MPEVLDRETIKALGTDTRQDIMKLLAKRPHTASELAKAMDKHVTTVSEHLVMLEKTGLIRKKESSNKWVYYALTDKGEHLFKPQYYSWVVVFSLSLVFVIAGLLRVAAPGDFYAASASATPFTAPLAPSVEQQVIAPDAQEKTTAGDLAIRSVPSSAVSFDLLGMALIGLGVIGMGYTAVRVRSARVHP